MDSKWRLVIHGGAGAMRPRHARPAAEEDASPAGLEAALGAGRKSSAVRQARSMRSRRRRRMLEDDPCFNAGRGSVLTYDGHIELDAAIMDGAHARAPARSPGSRTTRARSASPAR